MNKFMYLLLTVLIAVMLAACISLPDGSQANEQIQDVEVSPVPLLDLEPVLIQGNNFPDGYSAGQVSNGVPTYYDKILVPDADYVIRQQIKKDNSSAGHVIVFYYLEKGTVDFAFDSIVGDMRGTKKVDGVGDKVEIEIESQGGGASQNSTGIVFVKCHAVVHVSLLGTDDEQVVISYAQQLIKRLELLICA